MVMPEVHIGPPPNSNQTPVGPGHPWQMQGYPQQIKTWIPHQTPSVDNYQGVPQMIKTAIPTYLPPGVYPGTYGFIIQNPQAIKQIGPRQMKYGLDAGSTLLGLILGFGAGAVLFTATGRSLARASASRVTRYIEPKR